MAGFGLNRVLTRWAGVMMVALLLVVGFSLKEGVVHSALSLDQAPRCDMVQHVHDETCYDESGHLSCFTPEHSHGENCYLVRLEDNDINYLLTEIDKTPEKTLESLIDDVVGLAGDYVVGSAYIKDKQREVDTERPAPHEPSIMEPTGDAASMGISLLNDAILGKGIEPSVVLNEGLYKVATSDSSSDDMLAIPVVTDGDEIEGSQGTAGDASTFAIGDTAGNSRGMAYFYLYILDNTGEGSWTYIDDLAFSVERTSSNFYSYYHAQVDTSDMIDLINSVIVGSFNPGLDADDFDVEYARSASASNWTKVDVGSATTSISREYWNGNDDNLNSAKYVRVVANSRYSNPLQFCRVELVYPDATSSISYVLSGSTIELPSGYEWVDDQGVTHSDSAVSVSRSIVLTAQANDGKLRVSYDLNFPDVDGVTVATEPTIAGLTSQTVIDRYEDEECPFTVRNSSSREVLGLVDGVGTGMHRSIYFMGWAVNGDEDRIISPGASVTWAELETMVSGGTLRLTGVWEHHRNQTVSFYIRYDAVAEDTEGNITSSGAQYYTNEVFCTHLFGLPESRLDSSFDSNNALYSIATVSKLNSVVADEQIRKLYETGVVFQEGTENEARLYLLDFPSDAEVIAQVKDHAGSNAVYADDGTGNPVLVEDHDTLDADHYKVRWYVFKDQSRAWHVDGKLVKKEGAVKVTKTFSGNAEGIALAKDGFEIMATNGATTHSLTLDESSYESYDAASDTYTWIIDGIEHGESWTISEPYATSTASGGASYFCYADYRVVDAVNGTSASESSSSLAPDATSFGATISGQAYALDDTMDEILQVNFTNIYHVENSIVIKKEDARTGSALPGAVFQLWQGGSPLSFTYDSATGRYTYSSASAEGAVSELSGSASGYYEIMIDGFSYENGSIVVKESVAPAGYTPVANIEVGYLSGTSVGIISGLSDAVYSNGLLIVPNSTNSMSITVVKDWECPESEWEDVTVQLLANGHLASSLIPGVPATAKLTSANGYSHDWTNLPTHANGSEITWSVRETMIGDEACKSDYSFSNWIVGYAPGIYTRNADGEVEHIKFVVTNDTKRTMLRLTKTDMSGSFVLPGATFTLEKLATSGGSAVDADFITRTQATSSSGAIVFDNLPYGHYRLTETSPPSGYRRMMDPVFLTIEDDGTVVVTPHAYAQAGSTAFSIIVRNAAELPLPSTGGGGLNGIAALGGALCLISLSAYQLMRSYRRRGLP